MRRDEFELGLAQPWYVVSSGLYTDQCGFILYRDLHSLTSRVEMFLAGDAKHFEGDSLGVTSLSERLDKKAPPVSYGTFRRWKKQEVFSAEEILKANYCKTGDETMGRLPCFTIKWVGVCGAVSV